MGRFEDIHILLRSATGQLYEIENEYKQSLSRKEVTDALRVCIRHFLLDIRSPLDYLAMEVWERIERSRGQKPPKLYFPIRDTPTKLHKYMGQKFRTLLSKAPGIYQLFERAQPYSGPDRQWLGDFNELFNEDKHQNITPLTKRRSKRLYTPLGDTSPVKGINIQVVGEGARINIEGPFTIIHADGHVEEIPLRGSLSMDEEPKDIVPRWRLDLEWVDLQFEALPNNSILELLRKYLIGVRVIVEEFEEALEGPRARPRIEAPTHVVYLNPGDTPTEAFLGAGGSRLPAVEPEFRMLFVNSGSEHAQEVSLISGYQHTVIHPDPSGNPGQVTNFTRTLENGLVQRFGTQSPGSIWEASLVVNAKEHAAYPDASQRTYHFCCRIEYHDLADTYWTDFELEADAFTGKLIRVVPRYGILPLPLPTS